MKYAILPTNKYNEICDYLRNVLETNELLLANQIPNMLSSLSSTDFEDDFLTGKVTSYENSELTTLASYAFFNSPIKLLSFPNLELIGNYALFGTKQEEWILPKVTKVNEYGLASTKAARIVLPNLIEVGDYPFHSSASEEFILESLITIKRGAFYLCSKVKKIVLKNVTSIGIRTFNSCYSLTTVILKNTNFIPLIATDAFTSCYHFLGTKNATYNPNALKDGYIYVPNDLIEEYKTATNWSTLATQFRAIEDYPEICGDGS